MPPSRNPRRSRSTSIRPRRLNRRWMLLSRCRPSAIVGFCVDLVMHREARVTPLENGLCEFGIQYALGAEEIEQLAVEGITAGCGGSNYCPDAPVSRDQMAVFLVRAFEL